jgi:hypothetical protein
MAGVDCWDEKRDARLYDGPTQSSHTRRVGHGVACAISRGKIRLSSQSVPLSKFVRSGVCLNIHVSRCFGSTANCQSRANGPTHGAAGRLRFRNATGGTSHGSGRGSTRSASNPGGRRSLPRGSRRTGSAAGAVVRGRRGTRRPSRPGSRSALPSSAAAPLPRSPRGSSRRRGPLVFSGWLREATS